MATADILGWVGMLALISGYGLVSARGKAPGLVYQILNLIGSFGMLVNGVYHGAWPMVALNVVWAAIGIVSLTRLLYSHRNRVRATPADVAAAAPAIPPAAADPESAQ